MAASVPGIPWNSHPAEYFRGRLDKRKGEIKGRMPWDDRQIRTDVCKEFVEIGEAVAHLHHLEIVHRDIKPGNVLIAEDGSLRLADFGLVKNLRPTEQTLAHEPQTSTGEGAGTPGYMPPEQARGRDVGKSADVYSLGILLGELVLGERPVAEFPSFETARQVSAGRCSTLKKYAGLRHLPRILKSFIEHCTDVAPDQRPADASAMLEEFRQAVDARSAVRYAQSDDRTGGEVLLGLRRALVGSTEVAAASNRHRCGRTAASKEWIRISTLAASG